MGNCDDLMLICSFFIYAALNRKELIYWHYLNYNFINLLFYAVT